MSTLLVKNATIIVTMDKQDRELKDAAIFYGVDKELLESI